jgi:hypothetical protein
MDGRADVGLPGNRERADDTKLNDPTIKGLASHGSGAPALKKPSPPLLKFPDNYKQHHREAVLARDFVIPAALSEIIGAERVSTLGAASYLTTIYPDGKTPTDPIEKILLEQLVMAHNRSALLNVRAHQAVNPEALAIYNSAAVKVGAEIRRTALAIRLYRQPASSRNFSVIHQQNLATGTGGQQVTFVDRSSAEREEVSFSSRQSELEGNGHDESPKGRFGAENEESAASQRRLNQRTKAASVE